MKFLCTLPSSEYYRPLPGAGGGFLFEDKSTSALRLQSPVSNPWGKSKSWVIIPSRQNQRSDREEYPYRLILKLKSPELTEGAISATLERERVKGVFAWSHHQPHAFFAFPEPGKLQIPFWIYYSFYLAPPVDEHRPHIVGRRVDPETLF